MVTLPQKGTDKIISLGGQRGNRKAINRHPFSIWHNADDP
jgi:hypothetical protein